MQTAFSLRAVIAAATTAGLVCTACGAQSSGGDSSAAGGTSQLTPHLYVVSGAHGNMLVRVADTTAMIVGPQFPDLVRAAERSLQTRHVARVRFVVATDAPGVEQYGAGGWLQRGAAVAAQEALRGRIYHAKRDAMPNVGFSDVLQLADGDAEAHAVHQKGGTTEGAVSVHFESDGVLFLGEMLPGDGYPALDPANGGSIDGLIKAMDFFADFPPETRFVPARGAVMSVGAVKAYASMLKDVRARVAALQSSGKDAAAVVAAHPTSSYDAQYGRGLVPAAAFATAVDQSLRNKK